MRRRIGMPFAGAAGALALSVASWSPGVHAQAPAAPISGVVTSAEEGAMEGVLVSARMAGSVITTTVVTDDKGRYAFPAGRLAPGKHQIKIRAAGFDLSQPLEVDVAAAKGATADLKLVKTKDLAAQLTNAEWLESVPGTPQQKSMLQNCVNCHTVERVMRTKYTSKDFLETVLPRMQSYVNQSIPEAPQLRKAERLMEERGDSRVQIYKAVGDYLSQINLNTSKDDNWGFALKTFPRPKGKATRVVYTEYDLPRKTIQPHDVILDGRGYAYYLSFGEQFIGKLDVKTGAHTEFEIPMQKPGFPTGALSIRADKEGYFWLGNMYQAAAIRFDPRTSTMKIWSLPKEANLDQAQLNMTAPGSIGVDGKVWTQNNGFAGIHRLEIATGKWETWEPFKGAKEPHNIYDIVADSKNNVYFTDFRWQHIGRLDAKTGEVWLYEVPTKGSNPRRMQIDDKERLWFGEYRGHKIGMFDTKTEKFKEWTLPTPWSAPYDVTLDKNEHAWTGSMLTDRVVRLDTASGVATEYLTPRSTNIRRVHVDNTTTPPTFWVGNNHGASVLKLEPLD